VFYNNTASHDQPKAVAELARRANSKVESMVA